MIIKTFRDGSVLEFRDGKFDEWCVYMNDRPPIDTDYFKVIYSVALRYGKDQVYADFVSLYDLVKKERIITDNGHALIEAIAVKYGHHELSVDQLFTIFYATMVAEEQKAGTMLGCKIKRLGVHQVIIEDMPAHDAAQFSKGMTWRTISRECALRGF